MDNIEIFSAMQEGRPLKSFKKTILGKIFLTVLDPFSDTPVGILLEGDPKKDDPKSMVDVWTVKQEIFLKNMNRNHFSNGLLVEYVRSNEPPVKTIEESTDAELLEIVNLRYLGLTAKLNKIEGEKVLKRMVDIARENEKSEKIIKAIEARLSEVQAEPS